MSPTSPRSASSAKARSPNLKTQGAGSASNTRARSKTAALPAATCQPSTRFKEDFYNNNISYSKRGCVPCDHRAVLHNFDDTNDGLVAVPLEQAPLLNTIPEARVLVRRPDGSRQVFIRRFDKATSVRLRARMGLHRLSRQSIYCKDKDLGDISLSAAWISNRRKKIDKQ